MLMACPSDHRGGCISSRLNQVCKLMFSGKAALAANLEPFVFAFVAGSNVSIDKS